MKIVHSMWWEQGAQRMNVYLGKPGIASCVRLSWLDVLVYHRKEQLNIYITRFFLEGFRSPGPGDV